LSGHKVGTACCSVQMTATILSLVASVASAYINLRDLDQQLAIANATTESRAASVKVFTARFSAGDVSQMELAQSQSEYEASLATIPQIETQIALQEDALSVLLGRNPEPILRGWELSALEMPVVPAGLPSDLLERRPDLRQAEQNLVTANALNRCGTCALLSVDFADRPVRLGQRAILEAVHRTGARVVVWQDR
jgi:outer membrane protein, multidrug efflux system